MNSSSCNKKLWWLLLPILVIVIVVVTTICIFVLKHNTTDPEVTIFQGTLRGVNLVTRYSRNVFGFKGIPFAEPPVGDLRFEAPIAASTWDGTLDASSDSNDCVQQSGGDEDCLYLNVYTPQLPTSENLTLLPVMVYIHGGAFIGESNDAANFGPDYLLDQDVVLVVPSYRLGILGFLSTGDEVVPGNNGLKDLVKALEWSRYNIEYFGGDPNQTTIFGQSAGGIMTHLLALSSLTDGLFQRFISESGTALSYDGHIPREVLADRAIQVGEHLGCSTNTSTDLINCLRGVNTSQLLDANSLFKVWGNAPMILWSPTTEPDIEGAFLTVTPANLLNTGEFRDMAWLSTVNRNEGINQAVAFAADLEEFEYFLSNLDELLPISLSYDTRVENVTAYTEALKSYYFSNLTADRDALLSNYSLLMGDALCAFPAYSANQKLLAYAAQPQFLGSFEYRGSLSYSRSDGDTEVAHGDELIYLFPLLNDMDSLTGSEMNGTDWEMVDTMVELWTSFAIIGTPSPIWEQYSSPKNYLQIGGHYDTSLEVKQSYLQERMEFWEELTDGTTWL